MQELTPVILIDELHAARGHVKRTLATLLQSEFTKVYEALAQSTGAYRFNPKLSPADASRTPAWTFSLP